MPKTNTRKMKRDKTLVWSLVIVLFCALAGGGVAFGVQQMSDQLAGTLIDDLKAVPDVDEKEVLPITLNSTQSPARDFLEQVKEYNPENAKKTQVKDTGTASTPVSWICGQLNFNPQPTNGVQVFTQEGYNVIVQTFGAGQANTVLQQYRKGINNCAQRDGVARTLTLSPGITKEAAGFMYTIRQDKGQTIASVWVRGDSMITVSTNKSSDTIKLANEYDELVLKKLTATKCLSIDGKVSDQTRSPFYNTSDYTGWQRGRPVTIPEVAPGITVGYRPLSGPVSGSGTFIGENTALSPKGGLQPISVMYMSVDKPESPLPEGYKSELPERIPKPVRPSVTQPGAPITSTHIQERVVDPDGPSCGWVWAGQAMPPFDATDEKARADKAEVNAKSSLITDLIANMNQYSSWYNQVLAYNHEAARWISSVKEYNETASKWHSLNQIRAEYRRELDTYLEAVKNRETFISEQEKAQTAYDLAVAECIARAEDKKKTDDEALEVTPSPPAPEPSPDGTEPPPVDVEPIEPVEEEEDCSLIERPAILDQAVPSVPVPPRKPSVPLPDSWTDVP